MFKRITATLKGLVTAHRNRKIGTYMDRWYIIPPEWNLPWCVRLHHIRRHDLARSPHNHPYAFHSIVLRGFYVEEQILGVPPMEEGCEWIAFPVREVYHFPFKWHKIARQRYHRITEMSAGGVWTVIVHPRKPKEYEWGYLGEDGKHIPHAEYNRPPGYELAKDKLQSRVRVNVVDVSPAPRDQ